MLLLRCFVLNTTPNSIEPYCINTSYIQYLYNRIMSYKEDDQVHLVHQSSTTCGHMKYNWKQFNDI